MDRGMDVEERYRLKDGFDTPGLWALDCEGGSSAEWTGRRRDAMTEMYRRDDVGSRVRTGENADFADGSLVPRAGERHGATRALTGPGRLTDSLPPVSTPGEQPTWSGVTLALSLVGKVFTFGSHMIRGFYAGRGPGYAMPASSTPPLPERSRRPSPPDHCATPIPGAWLDDDPIHTQHDRTRPTSRRPPNKRRQTDRDSWIMVGSPDPDDNNNNDMDDRRRHPKRKLSGIGATRATGTLTNATPPRSRASPARRHGSFSANTSARIRGLSPARASEARRRTSCAALPLPTTNPKPNTNHRSSRPSSPQTQMQTQTPTLLTPEADRHLRRQAKRDRAADRAVQSMTQRLEDLIRQGQEALGTSVEVGEMEGGWRGGGGGGRGGRWVVVRREAKTSFV